MVTMFIDGRDHWTWDFRVPNKFAQWHPYIGKLTAKTELMGNVVHHVKVHDHEQLLRMLDWWLSE